MTSTSSVSSLPLPPGPRGLPLLGSLAALRHDPHIALDRIAKQYGDICLLRLGSVPVVLISHPETLREAFENTSLTSRWETKGLTALTAGKSLAIAPYGEHWVRLDGFTRRQMLSPDNIQMARANHVEPAVNELVDRMVRQADGGEPVHPNDMLAQSSFEMALRIFFGVALNAIPIPQFREMTSLLQEDMAWTRAAANNPDLADLLRWAAFLPRKSVKEARRLKEVRAGIFDTLVDAVRNRSGYDPSAPACLVDVMLAGEASGELTSSMFHDLLMDMMMPQTDGVATTVKFFLLIVANRPEIQDGIHEELDRVLGRDVLPTVDDRGRLPYTFAAIAESMRYRTASPMGIAHRASQDTVAGGYRIPAGAMVLSNLYGIHHDSRFWDSPHEVIPERFLPQADGSPSPALTGGAFIPFGVGHRRCTGEVLGEIEVWLYITRLMQRLRFETPEGRSLSEDEIHGLTILPKPYTLRAMRR